MPRPVFVVHVRAEPGVDPVRALRQWLKIGIRSCGLRCITINEGANKINIDFNNERDDDLIPDGLYRLHLHLRPGGYGDSGLLKLSKSGCLAMVDAELTVAEGPGSGRKMWETFNVEIVGNGFDPAARDRYQRACSMGRAKLRRIWESAHDIAHEDDSPEAQAKRKASIRQLDGLIFRAEVATRKQEGYRAQNYFDLIVTGPETSATPSAIVAPARVAFDDELPF